MYLCTWCGFLSFCADNHDDTLLLNRDRYDIAYAARAFNILFFWGNHLVLQSGYILLG